jgi:hypothetical protein
MVWAYSSAAAPWEFGIVWEFAEPWAFAEEQEFVARSCPVAPG